MLTTASKIWRVPEGWHDDACFIVCGGPSVADLDLSKLSGKRVIVVNNSAFTVPTADYLVFTDKRWWDKWQKHIKQWFNGEVVTVTPMLYSSSGQYHLLERLRTSGLSPSRTHLAVWHTSTTAATNLAVHLGVREINYLGLDGCDRDGKSWHHEPHIWKQNPKRYDYHREALEFVAKDLKALGINAYNANPKASHTMFPHKPYEDML